MKAFRFTELLKAAEFKACRFLNRDRERLWLKMPNLYSVVLILLIWTCLPCHLLTDSNRRII